MTLAKKVALVGFADITLKHLEDVGDDWEIWTAGRGWVHPKIAGAGIDRIVEIHDWGWLKYLHRMGGSAGKEHYDWLINKKHEMPVYMIGNNILTGDDYDDLTELVD